MILQGIVILLVLLVVANVLLTIFNKAYPPCQNVDEYFAAARKVPDGLPSSLGSIPSGTDKHYVGAKTVAVGIPGVVGLKSREEDYMTPGYLGDLGNMSDGNNYNEIGEASNDKPADKADKSAYDAISAMFPASSQAQAGTKKRMNGYNGSNLAMFETEMEGVRAKANPRNLMAHSTPSDLSRHMVRDGYH